MYFQHENALQAWRQAKMQADAQKKHYEDVRRQYEKVIWEQERLWTQEVLKNSYMETLAELGEQEGKYLKDMEAIQLAMQTIEGLAKDIHRDVYKRQADMFICILQIIRKCLCMNIH